MQGKDKTQFWYFPNQIPFKKTQLVSKPCKYHIFLRLYKSGWRGKVLPYRRNIRNVRGRDSSSQKFQLLSFTIGLWLASRKCCEVSGFTVRVVRYFLRKQSSKMCCHASIKLIRVPFVPILSKRDLHLVLPCY
jgi:hypothetical protein